jgi:hypothetical protein
VVGQLRGVLQQFFVDLQLVLDLLRQLADLASTRKQNGNFWTGKPASEISVLLSDACLGELIVHLTYRPELFIRSMSCALLASCVHSVATPVADPAYAVATDIDNVTLMVRPASHLCDIEVRCGIVDSS